MRAIVLLCAVAPTAFVHAEAIEFASSVDLAGAANLEDRALRLTDAERHKAGAAWLRDRQPVAGGFETAFQFRITASGGLGGGADGFAFVLQNSGPMAIGGKGSGGGFALGDEKSEAIPQSIAVFFDTFRNEEIGDRSNNFVTICTAGRPQELRWPPPRLASSKKLAVNLKDRKSHTVRIVYEPPVMSVYLDNARALATAVDLSTVIGADGAAWVGFTASTGEGYENHDILSWSFSRTAVSSAMSAVSSNISFIREACLPDRNLCTPERATVEETGPGTYHIILPGNLEWAASVPNPLGTKVTIINVRGAVCRDVSTLGAAGCAGPGALMQRPDRGRTSFSVNLPGDTRDREGYLEFDVNVTLP